MGPSTVWPGPQLFRYSASAFSWLAARSCVSPLRKYIGISISSSNAATNQILKAGLSTVEAAAGRAALELFAASPPDLIVLDILMPELDGIEVCREIRRAASTPILFLSSRDEEVDRIVGLELGGDDYVVKPFSPR